MAEFFSKIENLDKDAMTSTNKCKTCFSHILNLKLLIKDCDNTQGKQNRTPILKQIIKESYDTLVHSLENKEKDKNECNNFDKYKLTVMKKLIEFKKEEPELIGDFCDEYLNKLREIGIYLYDCRHPYCNNQSVVESTFCGFNDCPIVKIPKISTKKCYYCKKFKDCKEHRLPSNIKDNIQFFDKQNCSKLGCDRVKFDITQKWYCENHDPKILLNNELQKHTLKELSDIIFQFYAGEQDLKRWITEESKPAEEYAFDRDPVYYPNYYDDRYLYYISQGSTIMANKVYQGYEWIPRDEWVLQKAIEISIEKGYYEQAIYIADTMPVDIHLDIVSDAHGSNNKELYKCMLEKYLNKIYSDKELNFQVELEPETIKDIQDRKIVQQKNNKFAIQLKQKALEIFIKNNNFESVKYLTNNNDVFISSKYVNMAYFTDGLDIFHYILESHLNDYFDSGFWVKLYIDTDYCKYCNMKFIDENDNCNCNDY